MSRIATIDEIAKLAGVSKTTVSLVLKQREGVFTDRIHRVSAATAKKINDIIDELGYHPNYAARLLSNGSTRCIGFICGDMFAGLFSALLNATDAHGYRFSPLLTKWNLQKEVECIDMAVSKAVDGVIIYGHTLDQSVIAREKLLRNDIPAIVLDGEPSSAFPCVNNDFSCGLSEAFEQFMRTAHRKVALLVNSKYSGKLEPYIALCDNFAFKPIVLSLSDDVSNEEIARRLIDSQADGAIIENDFTCMHIINALEKLGVEVPKDISLACICTPSWMSLVQPPVDIIAYDTQSLADLAVRTLINRIEGKSVSSLQRVNTSLITRGGVIGRHSNTK